MSEFGSNEMEMDYGEQEEQNEEENEEENYQRDEENNSKYNDKNNYNNINNKYNNNSNINNSNNYNNSKNYSNNNNMNMNQNYNEEEQEQEQEEEQDQEQEQDNNISNNISSNKHQNNKSSKNANNNKKIQFPQNSISQDNNTNTIKNENIDESAENPEILYEEFYNYFLPAKKKTLNIKECKNAMRCLGLVVTEREIQEFLEIKEKTGREKINLEDFKSICNKKFNESNNNLAELEAAFEMLDPEKTGFVDSMVLRHQMKIFKPKITEEEINQILSEFGEDKNGNINYREYLKNIKS